MFWFHVLSTILVVVFLAACIWGMLMEGDGEEGAGCIALLIVGACVGIFCATEDSRASARREEVLSRTGSVPYGYLDSTERGERDREACEKAGFETPVRRYARGASYFYCADDEGRLHPVLSPLEEERIALGR